ELTLKSYESFVNDFTANLHNLQISTDVFSHTVWDIVLNPIALTFHPNELASIDELIETDNIIFDKILRVFASLCIEIQTLEREAVENFYLQLIFYGEGDEHAEKQDGDIHLQIGRMLPILVGLYKYVGRCTDVLRNCLLQLCIFYTNESASIRSMDISGSNLTVVYEHIGQLMHHLAVLDHVIDNQTLLKEHWKMYKRMIKSVYSSPESVKVNSDQMQQFIVMLNRVDNVVMQGSMFQTCINQKFEEPEFSINVSTNKHFSDECMAAVKELWSRVDQKIGEVSEMNERARLIGVLCLFVLHQSVFQSQDKKMFKTLFDVHKKIPCLVLTGSSVFYPSEFLARMLPKLNQMVVDKKTLQAMESAKLLNLQKMVQCLNLQLPAFEAGLAQWIVKLEGYLMSLPSSLTSSSVQLSDPRFNEELIEKCKLLQQGLIQSFYLRNTSATLLTTHATLNRPMTKSLVNNICHVVEMLKVIEGSWYRFSIQVVNTASYLVQYFSLLMAVVISNANKRVRGDKKVRPEVLSAFELMLQCLAGPMTNERILAMKLALGFCVKNKAFKDDELVSIRVYLEDIDRFTNFKTLIQESSDGSFLYWHRVILPTYFGSLIDDPATSSRLQHMLQALNDVTTSLLMTRHSQDSDLSVLRPYQRYVRKILNEDFLDVVCREIETDLRLSMHLHLQLDSRNPFKVVPTKQLSHFIKLPPLVLFDEIVNVKTIVENYLDKTFYNLTTVALHDWKTYSQMKVWAKHAYGLQLLEPHLPSQTIEQGLDILEIMRNIHVFVSKFHYNLNNQIFVEKSSNNKHLSTINIQHTSNSIRTHGTGIMNTTVNFTYQFLAKKFFIFSQFLYDEHIKSRLIKDLRYFKENHAETNQKYPFDRAEKFNRGIKKLGMSKDGLSYLDQFRLLITQIGNAMGYIRLIRSGGLHCCANAIRFVPDLDDIVNFEELCREEGLDGEAIDAARHLDSVVSSMTKNFSEGTEYFKMLVEVFSSEFQDSKNMHMRNFYAILPPLTLNFVDHMIASKDKLSRKNKVGASFTDDGFAMGIAYILKLLDQYSDFDSLHWFQSVKEKYNKEKQDIKKQPAAAKLDEKLQQTMMLTLKRLAAYQQEFDLLSFSLSSARIFFRGEKNMDAFAMTNNNGWLVWSAVD
ncbi:hypothetical protein HELRODRAFT_82872, partial [Helobdella robusta]|uniref:WASH complex subunit 7 n=1 Tax=Helobdella robusta TaxID=6412 RepID=T1G4X7_HELRO